MLSHAVVHSPYYREQAWAARLRAGESLGFREIPITPRALVRTETKQFYSAFIPPEDGEVTEKPTAGSTGEPMLVRKTWRHFQINETENQRLKSGWGYAEHSRVCQIGTRPNDDHPIGAIEEKDQPGGVHVWKLYGAESVSAFDLFRRTSASLAKAYPSIILAVLERSLALSETLPLRLIETVGEVVPDELRELVQQIPGCRLVDIYGCIETGLIAVQCPRCAAYHPADGHLALEIVADDGRPAAPGEMGRVIVTPVFNRAMPLIRYETGDYAALAGSNDCPRSPVALSRIVGRERNLFKLPDGRKILPGLPNRLSIKLGLRKFKLIQTSLTDVELHYIPQADGREVAQDLIQGIIDRYMAPGFKVQCVCVSELPRAPSGKYLIHECLV